MEVLKKLILDTLEIPENIAMQIYSDSQSYHEKTIITIDPEGKQLNFVINKNINHITKEDIILLRDVINKQIQGKGIISTHLSKFFGWWIIFSGSITLFAVCPICGSAGCVGSLAFTGLLSAMLALIKNYSSLAANTLKNLFCKNDN